MPFPSSGYHPVVRLAWEGWRLWLCEAVVSGIQRAAAETLTVRPCCRMPEVSFDQAPAMSHLPWPHRLPCGIFLEPLFREL
jgi:hypothetical protein